VSALHDSHQPRTATVLRENSVGHLQRQLAVLNDTVVSEYWNGMLPSRLRLSLCSLMTS
jgi:hypothetical protein